MSNVKGNGNGNGSQSKFQNAVDAARGRADAKSGEAETAIEIPSKAKAMILKPSQEDIAALMADETLEWAPQVHSLEEGEMIEGILEGRGPSTTFSQKDPVTGQEVTRVVDTWIIASPAGNLRMSILSSVQLDRKLPPFIGGMVKIYRGKEVKTGKGFRVTDYLVSGPRRPDGKPRSWVTGTIVDASANTIDGQDHPALPAPSVGSISGGEEARA